jgi:uncharacterized alkaline shock family protein YloU
MNVPAERRGRTDIAGNVVSKIATRAAQEVDGVVKVRRRGGGAWGGRPDAVVDDGLTALRLDVSVAYPLPLRRTADLLRRHVAARVHELTGLAIGHVDVAVASLVPGELVPGGPLPGGLVPDEPSSGERASGERLPRERISGQTVSGEEPGPAGEICELPGDDRGPATDDWEPPTTTPRSEAGR